MQTIKRIKEELKTTSKNIRANKADFKDMQRGKLAWHALFEKYRGVDCNSRTWRHKHIAYCMLRGKTYEQIEQKVKPGNEPNMAEVNALLDLWKKELADEQAVRVGA